MTNIFSYIAGFFRARPKSQTTLENTPIRRNPAQKAMTIEEISEMIQPDVEKSSCGCSRSSGRAIYWHYAGKMNYSIEQLRLYQAVNTYLHSYCENTGSRHTYNNGEVMGSVINNCDNLVRKGNHSERREAAQIERCALYDYHGDKGYRFTERFALAYLDRAKAFVKNNQAPEALLSLESARIVSENFSYEYASSKEVLIPEIEKLQGIILTNVVSKIARQNSTLAQKAGDLDRIVSNREYAAGFNYRKIKAIKTFIERNQHQTTLEDELHSYRVSSLRSLDYRVSQLDKNLRIATKLIEIDFRDKVNAATVELAKAQRNQEYNPSIGNERALKNSQTNLEKVQSLFEQEKNNRLREQSQNLENERLTRKTYSETSTNLLARLNARTLTRLEYKQLRKINYEIGIHLDQKHD